MSERWGDGLSEIERLGLHDRHNLICVQPTFSHLPWYGDHATDKTIRQESHLVKVCMPLVDRKFRQAKTQRRLLLGFSKSGWGAMSLLLRHPNLFAKAAAWDAPFTKKKPDQFGMGPIFGTQSNFERYCLLNLMSRDRSRLLKARESGSLATTIFASIIWRFTNGCKNSFWHMFTLMVQNESTAGIRGGYRKPLSFW